MNLAALLLPPTLDAEQTLRLRGLGQAALVYAAGSALVALTWAFGALAGAAALAFAAASIALHLGLYLYIRSGRNLRLADPSLTRFQIFAAITLLMYLVYHMDAARNIALFGCFIVFLFGVYRLNSREFTLVTLYTLAAYALVINLLMHLRPQAIQSVPLEWMSWLMLAGFLPGFALIGAQINTLRRRLRESEARFRSLTEMSSDFYWESDAEHRLTTLTSGGMASGVPEFQRSARLGERRWEVPSLAPDEQGWEAHRRLLDAHLPFREFELSRLGLDGTPVHVAISGDPVFDEARRFSGYRGVGSNITARKRIEQALRDSVEDMRLFADNVPAMSAFFDTNLHYRFVNKAYAEFFGLSVERIVGKHLREIIGEQAYREVEPHFARTLNGQAALYRRTSTLRDGEPRHLEIKLLPHVGDDGRIQGCFAVTTDITEHKLTEERIQRMAHHDSLTGLPNRLLFNDRLHQAINAAKRDSLQFALLYIDLDRFKPVNDTLGHAAGDQLLHRVGARLRRLVRESDTVARIGGDEFTMILADIGKHEDAEFVARKVIAALGEPFALGDGTPAVQIGASVGVAIYPADGRDADALASAADTAMYSAKRVGDSFKFFEARI